MNPLFISALVVLAVVSTAAYYLGTKKNRWIVASISKQLEEALKPRSTNYVNIGGVIGYNFSYAMPAPYTSAKGTVTMSPRHSILYLPVSRMLGVGDRFFVNVFTKKKLRGEAHIVDASYLRKANIDGIDAMERREVTAGGKNFVLLWRSVDQSKTLESVLSSLADPSTLRHFCSYPETGTFFIHMRPRNGLVSDTVQALYERLPDFFNSQE